MHTRVSMAAAENGALHSDMPSKGQVQSEREAEARRVSARARLDSDVRTALADGLPAEEVAKIVARALREGGMLSSADQVVTAARGERKK